MVWVFLVAVAAVPIQAGRSLRSVKCRGNCLLYFFITLFVLQASLTGFNNLSNLRLVSLHSVLKLHVLCVQLKYTKFHAKCGIDIY